MRKRDEEAARRPAPETVELYDETVPTSAHVWVLRAGITPERASDEYGFGWSGELGRVIIPVLGNGKRTGEWVGRNTSHTRGAVKSKYLMSVGATGSCWYDLRSSSKTAVVVEDVLSAIRVREAGFASVAVLGTTVSTAVASMLADHRVVGWFDNDAAGRKGFVSLRKKAGAFGIHVSRAASELDPKLYSLQQINQYIKDAT